MLENFMLSLEVMWKGMASIFAVIVVITLLVMLFQFIERTFISKNDSNE